MFAPSRLEQLGANNPSKALRAAAEGGGETSPHVSAPPTGEALVQDISEQRPPADDAAAAVHAGRGGGGLTPDMLNDLLLFSAEQS